jgi:5,10-methylene-tetrahydrofolate dehydrogenase/methenyl tetrahydrofolate cyclohydrolase
MELRHDYDIIEGPIADDKVQNKIDLYLNGKITREKFFEMISHHEETHQICFCTRKSLQMIDSVSKDTMVNSIIISEPILEKLMLDFDIDEEKATDMLYTSKTFSQLANETTKLYKKTWQEIYKLLKIEIINNSTINK